jgi:hypothetical protein
MRASLDQKSTEALALFREKTTLEAQVEVSRKNEEILVRLLQRPNGLLLQSLASYAADVASSSPSPSQTDTATVDASPRSLDASLTTNSNKTMS